MAVKTGMLKVRIPNTDNSQDKIIGNEERRNGLERSLLIYPGYTTRKTHLE